MQRQHYNNKRACHSCRLRSMIKEAKGCLLTKGKGKATGFSRSSLYIIYSRTFKDYILANLGRVCMHGNHTPIIILQNNHVFSLSFPVSIHPWIPQPLVCGARHHQGLARCQLHSTAPAGRWPCMRCVTQELAS